MRWLTAIGILFFCVEVCNATPKPACHSPIPWPNIQEWIKDQVVSDRLITPPWQSLCVDEQTAPKDMGLFLKQYLWIYTQFQQISQTFHRSLSEKQHDMAHILEPICIHSFPNRCGKPYLHRKALLEKHMPTPIPW